MDRLVADLDGLADALRCRLVEHFYGQEVAEWSDHRSQIGYAAQRVDDFDRGTQFGKAVIDMSGQKQCVCEVKELPRVAAVMGIGLIPREAADRAQMVEGGRAGIGLD